MPSFTLTNMAKADLKGIAHYTLEKWGRNQRNHYLSILDACFHQLAANPLKGKDCSEIRAAHGLSLLSRGEVVDKKLCGCRH
jgi:toxin ParE1/3/4